MVDYANRVIHRVVSELLNRSDRVREYLSQIGPGESGEYQQFAETIAQALASVEGVVLDSLGRLRELPKPVDADAGDRRLSQLINDIDMLSRWFAQIHEFLVYLPRLPVTAETVRTLEGSFGVLLREERPSVILGSVFNASEWDFLKIVKTRLPGLSEIMPNQGKNIVIELAVCDRHSPCAWAILAHELGHAIDQDKGVSAKVTKQFVKGRFGLLQGRLTSWCSELCADLIAAEALGPAPILSILSLQYCFFTQRPLYFESQETYWSHPTTRWRLLVVKEFLHEKYGEDFIQEECKLFEETWKYDLLRRVKDEARRNKIEQFDNYVYDQLVRPLAVELRKEIAQLQIVQHKINVSSMDRCVNRLGENLPISAQGLEREELREKVRAYRKDVIDKKNTSAKEFYELVSAFEEHPLDPATILLSANRRRLKLLNDFVNEACSDTLTPYRQIAEKMCAGLTQVDKFTASSIGSSAVHVSLAARLGLTKQ